MIKHKKYDDSIVEGELLLFHTIWHTSNDNMFIVQRDKQGDYISVKSNDSLLKTFNLSKEQAIDVPLKEILDLESYINIKSRYDKCIELNIPVSYEETHIIDNSNEERVWNTTILPVIDEELDITRIFGISREITQIKRLNEKLEIEVKKRTEELNSALINLKEISTKDKLTGIYNRYYLDSLLEDTKNIIKRYGTNYGLIILDIDNFKNVNDTYGHHKGDLVLQEFASLLKDSIRESDTVGRWGGEEFLIIVPHATGESIKVFANLIREKIQNHKFTSVEKITASFGLTLIREDDTSETLIIRADTALYKAKNSGKNTIVCNN